jgi:hypothetical protein
MHRWAGNLPSALSQLSIRVGSQNQRLENRKGFNPMHPRIKR